MRKGEKVWCIARTGWIRGYQEPCVGYYKYKIPKFLCKIINLIPFCYTEDNYVVISTSVGNILYPLKSVKNAARQIYEMENKWGLDKEETDPQQLAAQQQLIEWYTELKDFAKIEIIGIKL